MHCLLFAPILCKIEDKMNIQRSIQKEIEKTLFKGKVIIIYGPRRIGKTTLAKEIINTYGDQAKYINCDNIEAREALSIHDDKKLRKYLGTGKIFVIDEAQRVLNIGLSLKILVDTYPDIQIIATGSSSFDLSNRINEPLTGRYRSFTLFPISVFEIKNSFQNDFNFDKILNQTLRFGAYPEIVSGKSEDPILYLNEIANNYLYKDALEYEGIKKPEVLLNLLKLLAHQIGNEVSYNELATKLEVSRDLILHYIYVLEKAFVIFRLHPFSRNLRNEIGKKNKIYFYDIGIRNALISSFNILESRNDIGALWENFCIVERIKRIQYGQWYRNLYFWRNTRGKEIDLIEEYDGQLYGYEFKWGFGEYKIPKEFIDEYKNSSILIVNRSNAKEFLGF